MFITIKRSIFVVSLLMLSTSHAATRYVTDQFEVTLRSGTSTSNSILTMLKSGQAVTIIEEDPATNYTLVETQDGKQGYVLSRFLDNEPSGRQRFERLTVKSEKQGSTITALNKELSTLRQQKKEDEGRIGQLEIALSRTQKELTELKNATRDTVQVLDQNERLEARINELDAEILRLNTENSEYKDSTAMDWFIRGAGVSLAAFLLGILMTRIRWKKRDSWGNY
jgi:SH3 domain protein